jgi:NAD(P)-dependent dehydrogenase (short-subunit alcohol dehydrogenase family)
MYGDFALTADGIERTFAINHLSIFLLTNLLLDRLKASAPGRIITIASEVHRKAEIDFDDPNLALHYTVTGALAQSKLANILFTRALARRLAGSGVEAFSLHPGHVKTRFTRDLRGWFGLFVRIISVRFLTPDEGARTAVYLASEPDLSGGNGDYFDDCRPRQPSDYASDDAVAERLWALSEQMVAPTAG